jgi:hypothetical protein
MVCPYGFDTRETKKNSPQSNNNKPMTILKYVINEQKIPIIFSSEVPHNTVTTTAVSAGFLIINYDQNTTRFSVKCFGESTTLHVKAACGDAQLIETFLNTAFYSIKNK